MTKLISDIETFLKKGDADVVEAAKFAVSSVLPELEKVQADSSTITAIASLTGAEGAKAASVGLELVTWAVGVIKKADAAALAGGINATLDAATITSVKSITSLFPAKV